MPRYEFSEGSANKFWEINLSGKSFTTTYGKIGTDGQTTIKSWKDSAEAKKEFDKLVAEKTKKGYALVGGGDTVDDDDEDAVPLPVAAPKKIAKADSKPVKAVPRADSQPVKMPAANGTRHFEFSEGTSNKFWEITMAGTDVKTRYGKIGTTGQQTLKEFGDAGAAKKEYDKLVAEKTKKGYVEGQASNRDHFEEIEE
jgi:predicted DNA-binding WGR domain protein